MNHWKAPIRILILYLAGLALLASWNWAGVAPVFWLRQLIHLFLLVVPGWLLYRTLLWRQVVQPTRWEHRAVTALILFLLFDPIFSWWVFLTAGLTAEVLQRLLRVPSGPLLNPAAAAAVVLGWLGSYPTWWGTNFGYRLPVVEGGISLVVILTVIVAGYVAAQYKKLDIVWTAAMGFGLSYWITAARAPWPLLLEGTFAFFVLVMALEPKTSPALPTQQRLYGLALGVVVGLILKATSLGWPAEPFIWGLLFTNLGFNLYRHRLWLRSRFQPFLKPA